MIRICVIVKLPGHSVSICRIFARSVNKGEALVLNAESHSLESVVQNGRGDNRCTRFMICIDSNVCTIHVKLKMFKGCNNCKSLQFSDGISFLCSLQLFRVKGYWELLSLSGDVKTCTNSAARCIGMERESI